ncbi:uncharacterized protein CBL_02917 [Carabus blaptoides fortunei]
MKQAVLRRLTVYIILRFALWVSLQIIYYKIILGDLLEFWAVYSFSWEIFVPCLRNQQLNSLYLTAYSKVLDLVL